MTTSATPATGTVADPPSRPGSVSAARRLPWLLLVAGALGLAASVALTLDELHILADPNYRPNCDLNPIISCGSVMRTEQASAFGFPNPLIGLAGFSVVVTVGVAMLSGATFRRWFWLGLQAGTVGGIVFVHWLIDQTLYHIGALCPYCMVVWAATIPVFWYTTLRNAGCGAIPVPASWRPAVGVAGRYHWVIPLAWYTIIALLILNRFWYYWSTLL